jgi:hypothetical protein
MLVLGQGLAAAQTVVTVRGVPLSSFGSIDAADFDGDGDLDLMLIGQSLDGEPITGLFTFDARLEEPIPRSPPRIVAKYSPFAFTARKMKAGVVSWADVDGDGDPDLIVSGRAVNEVGPDQVEEQPTTDVFENQNGRTLIIRTTPGLPPLFEPNVAWADIDDDGDLDLALAGIDANGEPTVGIYRHDGGFGFSPVLVLAGVITVSDLAFSDSDGDGDPDLALTGSSRDGADNLMLDNAGGSFTVSSLSLPSGLFTRLAAGDFDADGRDDLLVTGGVLSPDLVSGRATLLRSEGPGFADTGVAVDGVFSGDVSWGDLEGDGDLDLLMAGIEDLETPDNQRIIVYEQTNSTFVARHRFRGVLFGPTIWFDYNGDRRLDILTAGIQEDNLVMTIYEL